MSVVSSLECPRSLLIVGRATPFLLSLSAYVCLLWGAPHKRHYVECYIMVSEAIIVR